MRIVAVVSLVFLAACGMSEEQFAEEMVAASCNKMVECFGDELLVAMGYDSVDECIAGGSEEAEAEVATEDCANYDAKKARECIEQFESVSCDSLNDGSADLSACETMCGETASDDSDAATTEG
jgi:hypothetical protein